MFMSFDYSYGILFALEAFLVMQLQLHLPRIRFAQERAQVGAPEKLLHCGPQRSALVCSPVNTPGAATAAASHCLGGVP